MAKHMAPSHGAHSSQGAGSAPAPAATSSSSASSYAPSHAKGSDRGRRRSNLLSNLLIVVGLALLVAAGVIYFRNQQNYDKIDEENERVAEYVRLSDNNNEPPTVDWEALKATNPDVVGWLQVPGTVINYPVFQAGDNDFYLNHAPDKSDSIGGSVFMDFENTRPGLVDPQTIVYGHHMRNGSQFKQIADMDNQELFDGVDTVWYVTEQGAFELAPLFLYYTHADDTNVRQFDFESSEAFHAYLNDYLSRAVAKRENADVAAQVIKRVFTLSTCNYYDGYGRTLLVCALKNEIPGTPEYEAVQAAQAAPAPAPEQPAEQAPEQPAEPAPEG